MCEAQATGARSGAILHGSRFNCIGLGGPVRDERFDKAGSLWIRTQDAKDFFQRAVALQERQTDAEEERVNANCGGSYMRFIRHGPSVWARTYDIPKLGPHNADAAFPGQVFDRDVG